MKIGKRACLALLLFALLFGCAQHEMQIKMLPGREMIKPKLAAAKKSPAAAQSPQDVTAVVISDKPAEPKTIIIDTGVNKQAYEQDMKNLEIKWDQNLALMEKRYNELKDEIERLEKKTDQNSRSVAKLEAEVSAIKAALWKDGKIAIRIGFFAEGKCGLTNEIKSSIGDAFNDIALVAKYLQPNEIIARDCIGLSSPKGSVNVNQAFSKMRAEKVADYCESLIKTDQINARIGIKDGFGGIGISPQKDNDKCVFLIVRKEQK